MDEDKKKIKIQWGPSTVWLSTFFKNSVQQKKEIHTGLEQLKS